MDGEQFKTYFELNKTKDDSLNTAVIIGIQGRQHIVDI